MVGEICDGRKETSSCGFNCAGQRKNFKLFNPKSNQCITGQLGKNNPIYENVQSFINTLPAELSKLIDVDSVLGDAFLEYYSCKHRPGAKYQNNQCINARKSRQEYACLNRMDIDEAEIKNSPVFTNSAAKRINHYRYFSKNLNGKIICGKNSLEMECDIRQGLLKLWILDKNYTYYVLELINHTFRPLEVNQFFFHCSSKISLQLSWVING